MREMPEDLFRDVFTSFIRVHILHHAAEEPIYGAEMIEELKRHGYDVSPGTLYPLFHRLEQHRYLVSESRNANGKIRKYYRITEIGRAALQELRLKLAELVGEVLGEHHHHHNEQ